MQERNLSARKYRQKWLARVRANGARAWVPVQVRGGAFSRIGVCGPEFWGVCDGKCTVAGGGRDVALRGVQAAGTGGRCGPSDHDIPAGGSLLGIACVYSTAPCVTRGTCGMLTRLLQGVRRGPVLVCRNGRGKPLCPAVLGVRSRGGRRSDRAVRGAHPSRFRPLPVPVSEGSCPAHPCRVRYVPGQPDGCNLVVSD